MYNYILFDFDGTVFDTVEGISKSVKYALNKHGMDAPLESLRCFAGPPLIEKFMEVFGVTVEEAQDLVDDYRERYKPIGIFECRSFPGIEQLLTELRAAGKKLAIATLKPQYMAESILERSGLITYFDSIFGSDHNGKGTKEEMAGKCMAAIGAKPDETILVGDTKYDILGAHKAGLKAIGVRYGYAAEGELEAADADFIVDTVEQLKDFLLK